MLLHQEDNKEIKMLTRLTANQISNFWDLIKDSVEKAVIPTADIGPDSLNKVLENLLSGRADCWINYNREEDNVNITGVLVTEVVEDDMTGTKNLLLYALHLFGGSDKRIWLEGAVTTAKWARKHKCHKIIAFTANKNIIETAQKFGGDTNTTLVKIDIDKLLEMEVLLWEEAEEAEEAQVR